MVLLPGGVGLWAGFLDRLPAAAAVSAVRDMETAGISVIWLQEYSGTDPFIRAAIYLSATQHLTVALGVATIHARDPEAMVAAAATLHEAFPGRFVLGLGVSHDRLVTSRGGNYRQPLRAMREYLTAMSEVQGSRRLPATFLGALGPRMVELAANETAGLHTYFAPLQHTAGVRDAVGRTPWVASSQMVAIGHSDDAWRDAIRPYLGLCLGLPNYRRNLARLGLLHEDTKEAPDHLVDELVVRDDPAALAERLRDHRSAGADHVVIQFVPPPAASIVVDRIKDGSFGVLE